jgi:hypothetical protein
MPSEVVGGHFKPASSGRKDPAFIGKCRDEFVVVVEIILPIDN